MPYRTSSAKLLDSRDFSGYLSVPDRKRFFTGVTKAARDALPPDLRAFQTSGTFNLMKVWYEFGRVHFEVVLDQSNMRIEVGLHFEDGPASTLTYLSLLDRRILELKHVLGHQAELERWTQSWGRVYELHPLEPLTASVIDRIGGRLALYIGTLWPLVRAAGVRHEREG